MFSVLYSVLLTNKYTVLSFVICLITISKSDVFKYATIFVSTLHSYFSHLSHFIIGKSSPKPQIPVKYNKPKMSFDGLKELVFILIPSELISKIMYSNEYILDKEFFWIVLIQSIVSHLVNLKFVSKSFLIRNPLALLKIYP